MTRAQVIPSVPQQKSHDQFLMHFVYNAGENVIRYRLLLYHQPAVYRTVSEYTVFTWLADWLTPNEI